MLFGNNNIASVGTATSQISVYTFLIDNSNRFYNMINSYPLT